ncbi:uncharacterized protein LOC129563306 [Moschus berezovskii]|uniref:uncharacterized protein LOC129563306 n=1 Tax=Moschus berezovskii TaxID=68408 RepID=UPI002444F4CD|nr:uncharacterized protein LOC129563306 [Moschus berezovskii]
MGDEKRKRKHDTNRNTLGRRVPEGGRSSLCSLSRTPHLLTHAHSFISHLARDLPQEARPSSPAQGLKPGTQSHGVHQTAATQPALQASVEASTGPSIWGSLFAAFLVPALKPSSQQPPPAHRPAGKLLPSCGGASSPPSNAPSNRITSAPSGPMRAENSCAPASRCEPRARGASETGGTDLQEPGLPAELQLPPLPLSRRRRRRRCRRQSPSEE